MGNWMGRVERGLSFRIGCMTLILGAIAGAVAGSVWKPAGLPVTLIVWAAAWLGVVMNDSQMVTCDACRKRVKMGATTCHHCGYTRPAS